MRAPFDGPRPTSASITRQIVEQLGAKKSPKGWTACCPAHEDRKASLTIADAGDKVLLHCFAGCPFPNIVDALGMQQSDMFADGSTYQQQKPNASPVPLVLARYDYLDPDTGDLLFQVERRSDKSFRQRRPGPDGSWVYNLDGVRRVLFRAPELKNEPDPKRWRLIVEGEKDVLNVEKLGFLATTNPGGAGKWRDEYNELLRGHPVIIVPDNDKAGRDHAEQVARSLHGIAAVVKIVELPRVSAKGDASDWIADGGTKEQLQQLAATTPDFTPGAKGSGTSSAGDEPVGHQKLRGLTARQLQRKQFPVQRFVIPGIIPDGAATLLAGGPKKGKTWLALGWALGVAGGGTVLGTLNVEQGTVLMLALEDGERRIQTRIEMMTPDDSDWPENLHIYTEWPRLDETGLPLLGGFLDEHPDTRLIIIDTLKKVRPRGDRKSNPYDLDYEAVSGLSQLAQERNIAIVVTHHTRKAKSDDVLEEISGTNGLTGGCDGAIVMHRERGSADSMLKLIHRDTEEKDIPLKWDEQLSGWAIAGDGEFIKLSAPRAKILQALKDHGGLMTPKEISKASGVLYGTVRNLLGEMVRSGRIFNPEYGRYSYSNAHTTHDSHDTDDTSDSDDNGDSQPPQGQQEVRGDCHVDPAADDRSKHSVMSVIGVEQSPVTPPRQFTKGVCPLCEKRPATAWEMKPRGHQPYRVCIECYHLPPPHGWQTIGDEMEAIAELEGEVF